LKQSFSLLTVLIVVVLFSFLSIKIVQNQTFSSQIDKLKYLEIQAKIHLLQIQEFIKNDSIENFILNDKRFELNYSKDDNKTHIYLNAKDEHLNFYKIF
jgi:type II secretory pathway pseudopilin PulG